MNKRPKLLVHFHLYYHDQIDYFINKLKNINGCDWDLFVTYKENNPNSNKKLLKLKPDTHFIKVKNIGYDILPFLNIIKSVNLSDYDYVLKIHTKNKYNYFIHHASYKAKGYDWRNSLITPLLGSKSVFSQNLKTLSDKANIGLICSKNYLINTRIGYAGLDLQKIESLKQQLNINSEYDKFIAGTMFLTRACCLNKLAQAEIKEELFENFCQTDTTGTIAHALERIFCILADDAGFDIEAKYNKYEKIISYIKYDALKNIFSLKNEYKNGKKRKKITILGVKICINTKKLRNKLNVLLYKIQKPLRQADTVCYTCITGGYTALCNHDYINQKWDYVCYTDNKELLNKKIDGIWTIKPLYFNKLDNTKNNRWHKMHPHVLFPQYEKSLYVDGNVNILTKYYSNLISNTNQKFLLPIHYKNNCIYKELDYILELNRETKEKIEKLREKYRSENMPEELGLSENNIIFRKHNDPKIINLMEQWWYMVENFSRRDQASFMYVLWKNNIDLTNHTFKNARYDKENCELLYQNYPVCGKTILITGGAGFIGSTLADRLLKENNKIIIIDNFNDYYPVEIKEENVKANLNNRNYKLYRADIEDKTAIDKIFEDNDIDAVVHIAARAGVRPSLINPLAYAKTNIEGTLNILEAMQNHNVKKLVFASSSSVYGNSKAEKFSEDLKVTEPISPYAATKSACEQFIYTYSKLYDIQAVCLRFFTVYGPRQRPDLAIRKFIELIEQNRPIPVYGDGTTKRDYTYIDDIVEGICSALKYDKTPYEIINLGGGSPVTLTKMIETIEKVLGKKAQIQRLPMQPGDVNKTVSDITKAKKMLNYQANTSFEEGIKKFIEWRKNEAK